MFFGKVFFIGDYQVLIKDIPFTKLQVNKSSL